MNATDRISTTTIHEIYFDVWGLPVKWCEAIFNRLHNYAESGELAESYLCEAAAAFRFQSTRLDRVQGAQREFKRLYNLCRRTYRKDR